MNNVDSLALVRTMDELRDEVSDIVRRTPPLRDQFAMAVAPTVFATIEARYGKHGEFPDITVFAGLVYEIADALLAARAEGRS